MITVLIMVMAIGVYALMGGFKGMPQFTNNNNMQHYVKTPGQQYYMCFPKNYNVDTNKTFPLCIYLHGSGMVHKLNHLNTLGIENEEQTSENDPKINAFRNTHPAFILLPQTKTSWDINKLIQLTEAFKKQYRIDTNRIYLVGYSMGGAATYKLTNAYYKYNKHLFAGIVRLVGQTQNELNNAVGKKTAVWTLVGLNDFPQRIKICREAYQHLKEKHGASHEVINTIELPDGKASTYTTRSVTNIEYKLSELEGYGHGISRVAVDSLKVYEWLFNQKLEE